MIRGLLYKFHEWVWNYKRDMEDDSKYGNDITIDEQVSADIEGIRFTVMPARGGTIVQSRVYDRVKDHHITSTYVIPDGEEISKEIGDIVSMELLRS